MAFGYERLLSRFGVGILDSQQNIDRAKLGALVFENNALRSELESMVHPLIAEESIRQIQTAYQSLVGRKAGIIRSCSTDRNEKT